MGSHCETFFTSEAARDEELCGTGEWDGNLKKISAFTNKQ